MNHFVTCASPRALTQLKCLQRSYINAIVSRHLIISAPVNPGLSEFIGFWSSAYADRLSVTGLNKHFHSGLCRFELIINGFFFKPENNLKSTDG